MGHVMNESDSRTTLIEASGAGRSRTWTLPPDLQAQAVRRLQGAALLFTVAYFLSGWFPFLLNGEGRAKFVSHPVFWLPGLLAMGGALVLVWYVGRRVVPVTRKLWIGVVFEVLASYAVAASQYHGVISPIIRGHIRGVDFGLSWVAPFVLMYTVLVPTRPRVALWSAILSVSSVPLVYLAGVALGSNVPLSAPDFFFSLVFPYVVVVFLAYFGARVVYGLGAAITRAREMGSYRLEKRLGQGGMGEVWRARHRMLARPAAIKLIRPAMLGLKDEASRSLVLRRFEREAQATALMRSPHTVELYDFGVSDDGTFYYVMELLDGFDLDDLVQRFGPVPAARTVHILRQLCDSLGEAHEAGLIHRDIKPANVYVCRYGREVDFIKVLDFGLVKHDRVPEQRSESATAQDSISGTPAFMSPEQSMGQVVDARSDIYAVGGVAYWLLTGKLVFHGGTALETIVKHIQEQPVAPSRQTELPIPQDLEALVLSCLAKDPNARPQSADELAARLEALPVGEEWTEERARAWWAANQPERPSTV